MTDAPPHEDPATDVVGYLRALKDYLAKLEASIEALAHRVAGGSAAMAEQPDAEPDAVPDAAVTDEHADPDPGAILV